MNETTFWQLYLALRKSLFADMSFCPQLTTIIRMNASAVMHLKKPDKGWEGPTRYFIKKSGEQDFIARDKDSGKWGPAREGKVIPLWNDEELPQILADPENLMVIPFFNLMDSLLFYLIAA